MEFRNINKFCAIDIESTGVDWNRDKLFGFSVSDSQGSAYYDIRETPKSLDWLRDQLKTNINRVVNHNIKFDIHMLRGAGVALDPAICDCTMIRGALINEHLHEYNLDALAKKYLGIRKDSDIYVELAKIFGGMATRNAQVKNFHKAPVELMARYAKQDTNVAMELWKWQEKEITKQGLGQIYNFERRLFPHIVEMERRGIRVDPAAAEIQIEALTKEVDLLRKYLDDIAGFPVNPNPSGSIKKLFEPKKRKDGLWETIDGTVIGTTKKGAPSLAKESLEKMKHPAAAVILKVRKYMKTRDTFIKGHILGHEYQGKVFPTINQTKGDEGGTGTGRLSYVEPALQQIPARDKEIAALVRPIFIPDEGQAWAYGDLDQHEYRVFAHYVNNPKIIEEYRSNPNLDFHTKVADLTGLPRNKPANGGPNAKQLNLGMVFNMGSGAMADAVGLPWTEDKFTTKFGETIVFKKAGPEALAMVESYHKMVPGIREMARKAQNVAERRGYIRTILGRHIRFPKGYGARKASGLIYQGSSADLNKLNIALTCEYLASEYPAARLLLNIHDEYSLSLPDNAESIKHLKEIRRLIEDKKDLLKVPIRIDFGKPSKNWWEATKAEKAT